MSQSVRNVFTAILLLASIGWAQDQGVGRVNTASFDLRKPPIPDDNRTQVLILATPHLASLGDQFNSAMLSKVLAVLERYQPTVIGVEALTPDNLFVMDTRSGEYSGVADQFVGKARELAGTARDKLGIDLGESQGRVRKLIDALDPEPTGHQRAELALAYLAADEWVSALLQWSYVNDPEAQELAKLMPVEIVKYLDAKINEPNEISSLGVVLASKLGLQHVAQIDDHLDKDVFLEIADELGRQLVTTDAYAELAKNPHFAETAQRQQDAIESGDLLPLYRWMNSPEYARADVDAQFHLLFRTQLASGLDRERSALWEVRNLNIASHIRRSTAKHPGGRMLVVIGAGHKPFLDLYLGQMMDVKVVQLEQFLAE
jgi:uncharacterized protein YjbJ (UPF0337 family)